MKRKEKDFGKVRVYQCSCGVKCFRELTGKPFPCKKCGQPLPEIFSVDDVTVSAQYQDHVGCKVG